MGLADLLIDLASVTYGLKPMTFLINVKLAVGYGYLRLSNTFVIDTQSLSIRPLPNLGLSGLGFGYAVVPY